MKKSLAKLVLTEMAMDLNNAPDFIDPAKKQKIGRRADPHSQNAAWPQQKPARRPGAPYRPEEPAQRVDPTQNYGELVASHVYPGIMQKVQQYTGRDPRRTHPMQLAGEMQQAIMQAMRIEAPHRRQLEQAAVRVVLGLPEFRDVAAALESGALRIEARLVDPPEMRNVGRRDEPEGEEPEENERGQGALGRMQVDPQEPDEEKAQEMGLQVPEIRQELDVESGKRQFINMMIQGAAINKNYAYHEIADELRAIDPQILNTYGKAVSIGELMYWAMPEPTLNQMMGSGEGAGGMEEIEQDPGDGAWVVKAYAICFPILIQEIVKGLYEFLAHNEDDPNETREYAYNKSDTLGNEQWDIMQGPGVWRHLNHIVNQADGSEFMTRIFRHLVTLPSGEFNQRMQEILSESPEGRQYIAELVRAMRDEQAGQQQESLARRLIRPRR